jgi:hypothetical protein
MAMRPGNFLLTKEAIKSPHVIAWSYSITKLPLHFRFIRVILE